MFHNQFPKYLISIKCQFEFPLNVLFINTVLNHEFKKIVFKISKTFFLVNYLNEANVPVN